MLKKRGICLFAVILASVVPWGTSAPAAVIYADDFDRPQTSHLNQAPDVRPGDETWQANDKGCFRAGGEVRTAAKHGAALLPFTPKAGNIYTLSATIDTKAKDGSDWIALGFCENKANIDFGNPAGNGYGWILIRGKRGARGSQTFTGPAQKGPADSAATTGPQKIKIVLDATDADSKNWAVEWHLDGNKIRGASKAAAGDYGKIRFVGFTRYRSASGTIGNFRIESGAAGAAENNASPEIGFTSPPPKAAPDIDLEKAKKGAVAFLFSKQQPDGSFADPNQKEPPHGYHKGKRGKWIFGPRDPDKNPKWNNPRLQMILKGRPNAKYEEKRDTVYRTCLALQALLEAGVSRKDKRILRGLAYVRQHETMHVAAIAERARLRIVLGTLAGSPRTYYAYLWRDLQRLAAARNGTNMSGGWGEGVWATDSNNHVTGIVTAVFACAQRNGIDCRRVVPKMNFWQSIQDYWKRVQLPDGGWGSNVKQTQGDLISTLGGLHALYACLLTSNPKKYEECGGALPDAIIKADTWLNKHYKPYGAAYGHFGRMCWFLDNLERMSGHAGFRSIDWYRHAARQLTRSGGVSGTSVTQTARALSFMASAQRPVIFNKLRFPGDWNNRPMALSFATDWMNDNTEWKVSWRIVGVDDPLSAWLTAPILYISGHERPSISDIQMKKLRKYICMGGTILSVCEDNGAGYSGWMQEFCEKAFPGNVMIVAGEDHPVFRKPFGAPSRLGILDNGIRPLVIHAAEDLAERWQKNTPASVRSYQLAANIATYVAGGFDALKGRGASYAYAGKRVDNVIRLVRIRHEGIYNPEPFAWDAFGNRLSRTRGVGTFASFVPPAFLDIEHGKVAAMTGTGPLHIGTAGQKKLKEYISAGGTVLVDAAGGDETFYRESKKLLEGMFSPARSAEESKAVTGGMLKKVAYRPAAVTRLKAADKPADKATLEVITVDGREAVYISREDITTGFLGFPMPSVDGYAPETAFGIACNIFNRPELFQKRSELADVPAVKVVPKPGLWYCEMRGDEQSRTPNKKSKVTIDMRETEDRHQRSGYSEVYTGYFYEEDGTVGFREHNDDHALIRIDGEVILHDHTYKKPTSKTVQLQPNPALPPGWHEYEMRFYNRTGRGGPAGGLAWGLDPDGGKNYRHPKDHPELRKLFAHSLEGGETAAKKPSVGDTKASPGPMVLTPTMKLEIADGTFMEFVYIKPGTFTMGGDSTSEGRFSCVETPKHEVTITKGFYLGKYEVTQAQFQAVMGKNPSKSTRGPNCPVDNARWHQVQEFCKKVAEKTGRTVRLPTEAEWEYACRAGTGEDFGHGADASQLGEYAWIDGNAGGKSHPVGRKKPNPWGLYDMHGNVCEWVADFYRRDYYANSPKENPFNSEGRFGNGNNGTTILRGGTWKSNPDACRAGVRLRGGGYGNYHNWGFRCAVTFEGVDDGLLIDGASSSGSGSFDANLIESADAATGGIEGKWRIKNKKSVGVGSYQNTVTFHSVSLKEAAD